MSLHPWMHRTQLLDSHLLLLAGEEKLVPPDAMLVTETGQKLRIRVNPAAASLQSQAALPWMVA